MALSTGSRKKILYGIGAFIIFILLVAAFSHWIVKWYWLKNLGYQHIFWAIKETQFLLFIVAFVVGLLYVIPNMYYLSKHVASISINLGRTPMGDLNFKHFNTRQIRLFSYIVGAFISFFFAIAYYTQWDIWFRFSWHQTFGQVDPVFGRDIGFYVFRLPFLETIQNSLILLVFVVTIIMVVIYLAKGSISLRRLRYTSSGQSTSGPVKHICINIGIWFLFLAWSYFLARFHLLYNTTGVVYGAGYTAMHITLPIFWVMIVLSFLMALLAFYQSYQSRLRWLLKGAGAMVAITIIGEVILPPAIQSFKVQPNELKLEKPYLKNNINLTRQAYNLNTFKVHKFNASDTLFYADIQKNRQTINNIRLWDPRLILKTYKQLQEIRLYYHFPKVNLARYHTNDGYKAMMISGRELEAELPGKAQTWVNEHLQYTHGYGVVMSPVAQPNAQGSPTLFIKNLPPVSNIDVKVKQPAIYYGVKTPGYKVVNTRVKELDYPKGKKDVYTHYQGKGGVLIDNLWKRLLFSWDFGDYNLLLSSYLKNGSKIQFWRSIQTRVKKIAPFLKLRDKPYLVLDSGKLYWIQDAYTTTGNYPYSQPFNGQFNYIRNSVKVVVNAYSGEVTFYTPNQPTPILDVYKRIFPHMFKSFSDMPGMLKQHIRYPEYLFTTQMKIYNTYHMTDPQVFYNNEDLWERPDAEYAGRKIKMQPYYLISKLPGQNRLQYLLISPLTPHNKDNMIAWMAAQSDFPGYGQVQVYELPKERLILGPLQIEAKINQNTNISRQLSLWDQRGSRVIRGNLMVIPIKNSFLYVEPVFLISESANIPQLKRVIVTSGNHVVMKKTIHEALKALYGRKSSQVTTREKKINIPLNLPVETLKLDSLKNLWNKLQDALQHQNWQQFGLKMQQIDSLL
jgi:uncharacterized membrane protein (UPF0182 family)